jgi:hypothetical protein
MKAILFILGLLWPLSAIAAQPTSPLANLSDAERSYYEQMFDYTMEAIGSDGSYQWQTYSANGTVTVGGSFVSKSKAKCRKFKEVFTVTGQNGSDEGVACKREKGDGWCRLKTSNAYTCAMEPPGNIVDEKMRDAEDAVESGKGVWGKVTGWWR